MPAPREKAVRLSLYQGDQAPSAPDAAEREHRYRRARDTLSLSLHAGDGTMVDTARIDVMGDEESATRLALEVVIVDRTFWSPAG